MSDAVRSGYDPVRDAPVAPSSATAMVCAQGTVHQAHASWTLRHPVLRIPIP